MVSLGKTYLIKVNKSKEEIIDGGIILPKEDTKKLAHYKGIVEGVGLGFLNNDNECKIGDIVYFDWKSKEGKVKLIFDDNVYYIIEEDKILAKEIE